MLIGLNGSSRGHLSIAQRWGFFRSFLSDHHTQNAPRIQNGASMIIAPIIGAPVTSARTFCHHVNVFHSSSGPLQVMFILWLGVIPYSGFATPALTSNSVIESPFGSFLGKISSLERRALPRRPTSYSTLICISTVPRQYSDQAEEGGLGQGPRDEPLPFHFLIDARDAARERNRLLRSTGSNPSEGSMNSCRSGWTTRTRSQLHGRH